MIRTLFVALAVAGLAVADEPKKAPADLMERIKSAGLENKPFTLIVKIKIKDGTKDKFETQAAKTAKASLTEKGCKAYELHADVERPNEYALFEKWDNLQALLDHLQTDYTKALLALFGEVSAVPPTVQLLSPTAK